MAMIRVTPNLWLDPAALSETFLRAPGPGGQNVNKVETAVQLRLDLDRAQLPPAIRSRLEALAGFRLTTGGEIIIAARRHRTRERNRAEALEALLAMIRQAAIAPVYRVPTRPSRSARQERMEGKAHRGRIKRTRGRVADPD